MLFKSFALFLLAIASSLMVACAIPLDLANTTLTGNSSALAPRGFRYHDNYVVFYINDRAYSVIIESYDVTDFRITEGQDPDWHNEIGDHHVLTNNQFKFVVGRHGSREVANWWNSKYPIETNTFHHHAHHLNFAFIGDLHGRMPDGDKNLHFTVRNFGLAQGHKANSNNWWVAADGAVNINHDTIMVLPEGTKTSLTFLRGEYSRTDDYERENAHYVFVDVGYIKK